MKKVLLILPVCVGCKKSVTLSIQNNTCYHCTFAVSVGNWQKPSKDTCGDVNKFHFDDPYNNDITFYCTKK